MVKRSHEEPKGSSEKPKGPSEEPKGPSEEPKGPSEEPKGPSEEPKGPIKKRICLEVQLKNARGEYCSERSRLAKIKKQLEAEKNKREVE